MNEKLLVSLLCFLETITIQNKAIIFQDHIWHCKNCLRDFKTIIPPSMSRYLMNKIIKQLQRTLI